MAGVSSKKIRHLFAPTLCDEVALNFWPASFNFVNNNMGIRDVIGLDEEPEQFDSSEVIFDEELAHNVITETSRFYHKIVKTSEVSETGVLKTGLIQVCQRCICF
jgi:hypothetical protein